MEKEIKNAKITDTFLGIEDHGIFTFMINLDYGGTKQGYGGYDIEGRSGIELLRKILEIAEVDSWENLPGQYIRVEADYGKVYRISHLLKDNWFDIQEFFNKNKQCCEYDNDYDGNCPFHQEV